MFDDVPDSVVGCNTIREFVGSLTAHAAESIANSVHSGEKHRQNPGGLIPFDRPMEFQQPRFLMFT